MSEPGTKKRRVESPIREDAEGIVDEKAEIERLITLMKVSTHNLKPVLADNLVGELPTVNVYVGTVIERKSIYKIIVSLTSLLPLTELQHLKRARNTEILICPSDGENIDAVIASLKDKGFDLKVHLQDDFKIVAVASKPPLLKCQHEKAHKIWPCNFHPNKYTEKMVSGEFFTKSDVERHRKYMALAYEVAEVYEGTKDRSDEGLRNVSEKADSKRIAIDAEKVELRSVKHGTFLSLESVRKELAELKGVLIVDPEIDSIVAVGYDRRTSNPCQHPVMIAIDNVAKSQFGGAWNDNSMFAEEIPEARGSNGEELVKDGVPKMFRNILTTSHAHLKFGAKRSIRRGELPNKNVDIEFGKCTNDNATKAVKDEIFKQSGSLTDSEISGKQDADISDEVMGRRISFGSSMSIGSQSVSFSEDAGPSKPSGPYLCTGYDVYTTNEPCIMCSMALVHSRARRVMFALRNEENGALASTKIHTLQALNHRYEVFTGFFEEPLL